MASNLTIPELIRRVQPFNQAILLRRIYRTDLCVHAQNDTTSPVTAELPFMRA